MVLPFRNRIKMHFSSFSGSTDKSKSPSIGETVDVGIPFIDVQNETDLISTGEELLGPSSSGKSSDSNTIFVKSYFFPF